MDDKIRRELVELFKQNKLVPVTKIKGFKGRTPSTVTRWAIKGVFPSLKVGRKYWTSEKHVDEALAAAAVVGGSNPGTSAKGLRMDEDHQPSVDYLKASGII